MYSITIHQNHKAEILATFECDCGIVSTETYVENHRIEVHCKECDYWLDVWPLVNKFRRDRQEKAEAIDRGCAWLK